MCGGSGEGGGRGAELGLGRRPQAGHPGRGRCVRGRAAAARVGAGGGARCTVTRSCAPWPRGDIHRPAGPGSASAPRAAHGSAAARGSRTAPRFAPSYFDGRWGTAEGGCPADKGRHACGPGSLSAFAAASEPSPGNPGNLGRVVGIDCGTGRCAEKGGDPEPQAQPRRRPGTGEAAPELASSGLASKTSKKSLGLRVFQQVPSGVRATAAVAPAPRARAESQGFLGRVWVHRRE